LPVYDLSCACGREWEAYVALRSHENPLCVCGQLPERVWGLSLKHVPGGTYPYTTTNLRPDGKPVTITSDAHLQRLCKEFGATPRPDNGWLTKEYKGVDFKTGKQIYKEGSGMGLPGSWF
jgi:hypothetical protein